MDMCLLEKASWEFDAALREECEVSLVRTRGKDPRPGAA